MVSMSLKQHAGTSHSSLNQSKRTLPIDEDEEDGTCEVLKVNEAYAKRLAHNKQREAQHRLEELKKRGVVDSSDEADEDDDDDESSDDGYIPSQTDAKIFETLTKIKKKDPSIYSEDVRFFQEDGDEGEDEDEDDSEKRQGSKSHKPIYLKDAIAKQLIEDGSDFGEDQPQRKTKSVVTYADEQQAIKNEFLLSVKLDNDEDDDRGGFLKLRKREGPQVGDGVTDGPSYHKGIAQKLEEYFGNDDNLDESDKFLKDYLLKKSWVDEDADRIPSYEEIVGEVIEDEEELEKQDRFEAGYNFRFEEGAGSQVMGYSRIVEDSVRRKDDRRKLKREKKKERLSEAAFERREELKRLKNIKRKEVLEKLQKIRSVAGMESDDNLLEEEDLEEEFDPDEYDRKMREAFGVGYYEAKDVDEKFQGFDMDDLEKPDFDAEDELLGLPKGWDEEDAGDKTGGFAAIREKMKLSIVEHGDEVDVGEQSDEDENLENFESTRLQSVSKRRKKGRISLREKLAFDKQLEEYYKLDYEDMVGDLPTRFKYRQVTPNMFGLSATEILAADDKDLNQYVSLKKIAPYVTQEWKPKWRFQISQKTRKKTALKQQILSLKEDKRNGVGKLNRVPDKEGLLSAGEQHEVASQEVGSVAEGCKKRKRRKKGLSLSESRLIAYGKISLPSKKKKKKQKQKQG